MPKAMQYPVICLCGSTRFKDEFIQKQKEFTLAGYVVLSVGCFGHIDSPEVFAPETKRMLDDMHKQKIDMSDKIYVINKNGYIGESTYSEIEYAKMHGKEVIYMEGNYA